MFVFLYCYPPFHTGEAEQVVENILARRIQWPDEAEPPLPAPGMPVAADETKDKRRRGALRPDNRGASPSAT
jgi:hypothetical protein